MKSTNATKIHRKSGGAQSRDLLFPSATSQSPLESTNLPFVIPTEAYPDFLPPSAGQGRVCAFL
jgi:hypothetical protein